MEFLNRESFTFHPGHQTLVCPFCHIRIPFFSASFSFRPGDQILVCPFCRIRFPSRFASGPFGELQRSLSLLQLVNNEGFLPSPTEETKRRNAIDNLKEIVNQWIKRVVHWHQFPKSYISDASATILIYGSYDLGVHDHESDVDVLCVGPCFATMDEDFFVMLRDMLASRPEVSDIICIKDARVPLMRFNFDGIQIDLPFVKLSTKSVPKNLDVLNPFFLTNIDEVSRRSLSGVRANKSIVQSVPNLKVYQSLLRCVRFWAKRRGIYGHVFGFFGGMHLAVFAAFICWRHPGTQLSALVSMFFQTFAFWHWPMPIVLGDGATPSNPSHVERYRMTLQFPHSSADHYRSNITRSTFNRINMEFRRAHTFTKDVLRPYFKWDPLFEPLPYAKKYAKFLRIRISSTHRDDLQEWVGWIKSRIRCLLIKLEELRGFCDPNPTEYTDYCVSKPNVVFYWGLSPDKCDDIDIGSIGADFMMNIIGFKGPLGSVELTVVAAAEFPKTKK